MNLWTKFLLTLNFIVLCSFSKPTTPLAQSTNYNEIEVYLEFRHRGIIGSVVTSYYKDDHFFLPVNGLFSLFKIDHTFNGLIINGRFGLDQIPYRINFQSNQIRFGDKIVELKAEDYLVKELDSYIKADIFFEAFGLDFSIDFNNLSLKLQTQRELPAIAEAIRKQRRRLADDNRYQNANYELLYDRERPFLDGGFIDYNLSANVSSGRNIYNANTNLGIQLYGGDLQGSIFGSYSESFSNVATNNLRWRYMFRDQSWLSKLTIGQTTTDGVARNSYTGVRFSNEPIEPRRLFDEFEVQGNTIPQSEVELYKNNALIDFQQANEMGDYRFLSPITYGSSQLDLKIYGPTGQIIERSSRIQVPFTFQPKGEFNYNLNIGQLDNPIVGNIDQNLTAQGSGAFGLTNWLTAKAGVEYYEGLQEKLPTFTSTLSSRILSNYILTAEFASNAYYRGVFNTIFPNSASINVDYTDYISGFSFYNPSNEDKRLVASAFYPFNIFGNAFNFRASTFSRIRGTLNSTTVRVDASSRLGKMNLRVGYSDRFTGSVDLFNPTNTSYIETSATYNISRNRNLPAYIRGVFIRAQMRYQPTLNMLETAEALISRNIFQQGRFQLSVGRNFRGNFNTLRFSLVVGFDKVRTNTTYNSIRGNGSFTQNVRGSMGYDTNYNNFIFTSRNQVGRSGAAIQLFVDNNGNGNFDKGDEPVSGNAVRVNRSGASSIQKNGILYYTQMQPYFYYNMEMNKGAINNPMLVPEFEKFGLITDPNRFKKVEIPFYMSGVIEGVVERQHSDGRLSGIAGLKLLLEKQDNDFMQEIRTFSDGSFYAYEIPPGEYEIKIDSSQLNILNSKASPGMRRFEVKAIPEGDFVEKLNFLLLPEDIEIAPEESPVTSNMGSANFGFTEGRISVNFQIPVDSLQKNRCNYLAQLGAFSTEEAANSYIQKLSTQSNLFTVYNKPADLFAVRKNLQQSMGEAYRLAKKLNADIQNNAVIINQCDITTTNIAAGAVEYELQAGAFSNINRASAFAADLKANFTLETFQVQDNQSRLHKVKIGPFQSLELAQKKKQEIISSTSISDLFITKNELSASAINVGFNFMLQLGEFEDTRTAALYALRIEEEYKLKSKILIDENFTVTLVLNEIYEDWSKVLKLRDMISSNNTFHPPLIHLLEFDL
ncbi:MAG: SPOR domain-containing protein [Balneolaceae bacterium]